MKFKERNYYISNDSDNIIIRSLKNVDMVFYKNWYKIGHIKKEVVDTIPENEIDNWILRDVKTHIIFIVEINNKPCGEINIWNDTSLIIMDKNYKKPYYNFLIKYYENVNDDEMYNVLKFYLESIKNIKIKTGSFYVFIDEKDENNYIENYLNIGFKYLNKDTYKSKTEKFFIKNNIDNPYKKMRIVIKNA